MFIDEVKIEVTAGRGGNGIVAYRRELKVDLGGPFGGSGGRGGDVIFVGDEGLSTLLDLRYQAKVKGKPGEHGKNKGMSGAYADHTYIRVPLGTLVYNTDTNILIADVTKHKQEVVICKGGRGGRGNMAFATGINKCPDFAEKGEPGEVKSIRCELKVLADCGLVGFPSVGKSTLISAVSQARPKIASYHFTTLVPNLGMVYVDDFKSFVMADLPGIIEGASKGAGLGLRFLRHIERCKVILHVIDMSGLELRDPYEDYLAINEELKTYKMNLSKRPQIIVANKMDVEGAKENLKKFKEKVKDVNIVAVSAYTKENTKQLVYDVAKLIDETESFSLFEEDEKDEEFFVNYTYEAKPKDFIVFEAGEGIYEVKGEKIEKLVSMTNFDNDSAISRFARQLRGLGVDDELRKAGAKDGNTIRVYDFEFDFVD